VDDVVAGQLIDGRYRVETRLARGGMATIYLATDMRLERTVALKVMHARLANDAEFVSRFIREARSAARLSHPNVVAVFDQGTDAGHVFLTMEYIEGHTLRDLLVEGSRLSPRHACEVLEPVLAALGAAHRTGIIHRDVKPENVLLAHDGRIKVADFGLARGTNATAHTSTGILIGTMAYLAPEQVEGGVADPRSDVYAAGVMLYEMLTGVQPHRGENPLEVAYRHVHHNVPPPSAVLPDLPPALDALVALATCRDPDGRPANANQLLAEVSQVSIALPEAAPNPYDAPKSADEGTSPNQTLIVRHPPKSGPAHSSTRSRWGILGRLPSGLVAFLSILLLTLGVSLGAWWLGVGQYTRTPSLLSLTEQEAKAKAEQAGLDVDFTQEFSEIVPNGQVIDTDPQPTDRILRSGTITAVVSRGPERYEVPDLAGKPVDEAKQLLTETHLTAAGKLTEDYSDTVPQGAVISSDPAKGATLKRDSSVRLIVSKGPPPPPEIDLSDIFGNRGSDRGFPFLW